MPSAVLISAVAVLATVAGLAPAMADEPTCPMPYAFFEYAVPHLDLDECPTDLGREKTFCRASVANDAMHVFVFALEGEQCLLSAQSYAEEEITLAVD